MRATESARSENARNLSRFFNESGYTKITTTMRPIVIHAGSGNFLARLAKENIASRPTRHGPFVSIIEAIYAHAALDARFTPWRYLAGHPLVIAAIFDGDTRFFPR